MLAGDVGGVVDHRDVGAIGRAEEVRLDRAVGLYARRRVTLGRAARIAGVTYSEFLQETGRRGLCVDYDLDDATADIEIVRKMRRG